MKKIIAFLILLLCLKQSYAQYPLKQYLGSDSTLVTVRGGMNARLVLWSFTDTTQANTQRINQYAGALIYTTGTDKVWYRNSTATGWIEFTSSGGTTTNIYNSDGFITGTRVLDLSASPLTFSRSGVKQFAAEDNLTTIGSPNNQKRITVYNDSITILGLSQTTDTTTYKPLAIDADGYFTIMDRWPGGGGSAGWALTGNAGTDIATNFIGTTDSVGFRIRINNQPFAFFSEYLFGSLKLGYQALFKEPQNVLTRNIAIGREAMYNTVAGGTSNIAIGWKALYANTTGTDNIGIGIGSLISNTTGIFNTALGQSLISNTTGSSNTALGFGSLNSNTTASDNTAVGINALYSNTTARYNTAVGSVSLYANTTGAYNSALGFQSMRYNTTGEQNSAFGANSLYRNTTGIKNSALGSGALENNTSGQENTAVGQDALLANTTGIRNIGIGWNGFANNFTGGQNVGIGYGAGKTITNGNNNTILGAFAAWDTPQNDTITGAVIIGHSATASEDSTVVLGNDYIKKTHLKGVVYAPFTTGDATTSDSALVVDRSTGAFIMRPVAGGGTYTFTNGLTNSSGTVKLGGTLTEHTTIDGNNKIFEYVDGNSFTIGVTDQIQILSNANGFETNSTSATIKATGTGKESMIIVSPDSIAYNPHLGVMRIDTLAAASNMTNKRVMTWDTVTKRWEQIAKDSVGGGGSTSPVGNYGNLQINRNGAFATPASDSLTFTTTDGLKINNQLLIRHGTAGNAGLLLRPIGASDPYTPLLNFQATSVNTTPSRIGNDYGGALNIESANFFATFGTFYGGTPTVKIRTYSYSSGSGADNATINIYNPDAAAVGLRIKGYTSATGNLFELVNSSSTGLSAFDAAGDLGIGTITPAASAKLDITSTTQGFLPPRMTGAQQNAISSPATGLMIYNTDSAAYTSYNGSAWQIVGKYLFGLNDALSSADRTFNLNNYKLDLDSGSFHIKRKVTGQRTDDIFSVGIGPNKSLYVAENGQVYATEFFSGSGSFYSIGGALGINGSNINLSGNTIFQAFQKKFEINKSWPALNDSIGFEIKNDTFGISTLGSTWADTYKIASFKYRSGVDNSLIERFDFRGNGDFNITGTGAIKINVGNTSQRPATPTTGMTRINTDSIGAGYGFEYYNGTAWVNNRTAGGVSDGYVDNATFNTTTNYLTIEQTGAADVSVRIPPSYIRNALNADSISKKENDSTLLLKAITVTTNNNRLTTTVTRTDSTLNFLVDIKRDTVTLASFGAGGGQAGDTTAFSTSTIYGSFYNDGTDTLVITSMRGILQGTSPSVTYDVYYNDSLNVTAGASKLVTAGTALTNTATGAAVTSFDNTKIPPGVWVWVKTTTVTTKPTYFSLSLVGYKSRKA